MERENESNNLKSPSIIASLEGRYVTMFHCCTPCTLTRAVSQTEKGTVLVQAGLFVARDFQHRCLHTSLTGLLLIRSVRIFLHHAHRRVYHPPPRPKYSLLERMHMHDDGRKTGAEAQRRTSGEERVIRDNDRMRTIQFHPRGAGGASAVEQEHVRRGTPRTTPSFF